MATLLISRADRDAVQDTAWHARPLTDVLSHFGTSPRGLSNTDAERLLARYGPNALAAAPLVPAWRILIAQLTSVVMALLCAAATIAFIAGDTADGYAIVAVLVINISLGFATEWRARRAMTALLRLDVLRASVLRDGVSGSCDARALVPGDVIELEEGQLVPADARILTATELRVQEAILTGESMPSHKAADDTLGEHLALADRSNMVYKSTMVSTGRARAVVVATGDATEVGRINVLVRGAPEQRTPLERRLDELGRQLIWLTLAASAVVATVFFLRGLHWRAALETGIALAVAAVPEGLPAIATIAMAVGVWRMARRRVIVRRLPVVETLGAATVICTDKTGTLTTGEMTATALWVDAREYEITGVGHSTTGAVLFEGTPVHGRNDPLVLAALRIAALANRGELVHTSGESKVHGDPTDIALLVAAEKGRVSRGEWRAQWPEIGELPFSSERKMMATVHRGPDGEVIALMKGAPMTLLARSARILTASGVRPLDDTARNAVQDENAHFASRGLRVLALAYSSDGDASPPNTRSRTDPLAILDDELIFVGLIGMEDAPVPGIETVVSHLRAAGLRTIMLTGDQRLTAETLARRIGILTEGEEALDGESIATIPTRELALRLGHVTVVSRVSPADKLRVVHALREAGEVVAMIGDGVNDAPALKSADIGIAMGIRGTDVAKEAAAMVLQDDRLETVDAAIEEGRVIFDNIQKAVLFLFSCNIAEVLVLLLAGVLGLPLPLAPLQILWLNLVTDTLPAIALALEPAEKHLMRRAPASPKTRILSPALLRSILAYGALITAATLAAYGWAMTRAGDSAHASTIAWMTLAFSQLFHVGNVRSKDAVLSIGTALRNPFTIGAVAIGVALQLAAIEISPLARALGVHTLSPTEWVVVIAFALAPAVLGQAWKQLHPTRSFFSGVRA